MEPATDEYKRGRQQGQLDWACGTRRMYASLLGAWGRFTFELFSERYDILVEQENEIMDRKKLSYEAGYNSVAKDHITKQDGAEAWDRIQEEIQTFRKDYYRKHIDPGIESPKF